MIRREARERPNAMTDRIETTAPVSEDRTVPAVVYGLYLIGLTHGLTTVVGLIIAYACRDNAGPRMGSHYTWLIRTFWITLAAMGVGVAMIIVGGILSLILIGIPIFAAGWLVFGAAWVYCIARLIIGVVYLARDEEIPRPYAYIA
jgi:uncharacterized membrane protein